MRTKHRLILLAVALLIPALWLLRPAATEQSAPVQPTTAPSAPVPAVTTPPPEAPLPPAAAHFNALLADWEAAGHPRADQIEEQLKALLTDDQLAILVTHLPAHSQNAYVALLALEKWAAFDRPAATRWLAAQPAPTAWQATALARDWISKDADGYLTGYLDTVAPGPWHDRLAEAMIHDSLAQKEPVLAFALAKTLAPGSARLQSLQAAALQWSEWDARAALDQVNTLPDVATQEKLIPYIAIGYATTSPQAAAEWLLQSLHSGDNLNLGLAGVIQIWTRQHDAAQAAAWVSRLPAGSARQAALAELRTLASVQ